jgi:hypothetical protein
MEMTKAGVLAVFSSNNETEFDRLHGNKSGRYAAMKVRRAGNLEVTFLGKSWSIHAVKILAVRSSDVAARRPFVFQIP